MTRGAREPNEGTQNALVLAYLRRHGTITPAEAREHCDGCTRLAARIEDLERDFGLQGKITSVLVYRGRKHWSKYTLVEEPQGVLSL